MYAVLAVFIITALSVITSVIVKPYVKIKNFELGIYYVIALIGAVILVVTKLIDIKGLFSALTSNGAINPLKILALFISMTVISVFLDELGFFEYMAGIVLQKTSNSQKRLFVSFYLVVSVLTVFTSNDIVVLTFTPFICHFCKNAKINPIPYLVAEFIAANTFSMMLIIGNPTNLYLATMNGVDFIKYLSVMIVPSLLGGMVAFGVLYLIFRKQLEYSPEKSVEIIKLNDKPLLIFGVTVLFLCTVLIAISSYIGIEIWYVCVFFALIIFIGTLIYKLIKNEKPTVLKNCLKRAPWELIPFVLSMFTIVYALDEYGLTEKITSILGEKATILKYGVISTLSANVINNIPMSVLFSAIVKNLSGKVYQNAIYASIIGSNIGAFITPVGALAGIMWTNLLKKNQIDFGFKNFVKYGVIVGIPTLLSSLLGLFLVTL